jgi:hypothetical protein
MNDSPARPVVGHMIPVTGLLAGFSFTALVELITYGDARAIATATIAFALLSALLYILSLFAFIATISIPRHSAEAESTIASIEWFAFLIFWLATLGLLTTVALAAWIHSTLVGILGTVVAILAVAILGALLIIRARVL